MSQTYQARVVQDLLTRIGDAVVDVLTDEDIDDDSRDSLGRLVRACQTGAALLSDDGSTSLAAGDLGTLEGISVRTYNALHRAGVRTISELRRRSEDGSVAAIKGIGASAIAEIHLALEAVA